MVNDPGRLQSALGCTIVLVKSFHWKFGQFCPTAGRLPKQSNNVQRSPKMLDLRGIVFSILVNHLLYLCNELNYRISIVHDPCKCSFAQALIRIEIFPSFTSSTNVALEFKLSRATTVIRLHSKDKYTRCEGEDAVFEGKMRPEPQKHLILTHTAIKIGGFRENKAVVCLELESSSRSGMQLY